MKLIEAYRAICSGGNDLKGTERLVLLILCDHLGNNDVCWPSDTRISEMAGINKRQIKEIRERLMRKGYLTWDARAGETNVYRPSITAVKLLPASASEETPGVRKHQGCGNTRGAETPGVRKTQGRGEENSGGGVRKTQGRGEETPPDPLIEPLTDPPIEPPNLWSSDDDQPKKLKKPKLSNREAVHRYCEVTGFQEWWEALDNKKARQKAEEAWVKLSQEDRERATERTIDYHKRRNESLASGQWNADVPHGSTFLNQKRWNDEFKVKENQDSKIQDWKNHRDYQYFLDNLYSELTPQEFRTWLQQTYPELFEKMVQQWEGE